MATRQGSATSSRDAAPTLHSIDFHDDDSLLVLPDDDTDEDIRPDEFATTTGFLRAGAEARALPRAEPGPTWSFDEADERALAFLEAVVGERQVEQHDDPIEHARANGLMILFGPDENEAFETLLVRMPGPRVEAWRDLMSGGASSEAFGPLTLQERLDEKQVDEALQAGRKQRAVNLGLVLVVAAVVLGAGVAALTLLAPGEERSRGALQFDEVDEDPAVAAVAGGPPVAEPLLTDSLGSVVAVASGAGDAADRIADAPSTDHRYLPGELRASLFQYAASGQVAVVGPEGFVDNVCLRASVVTAELRPLDTVWFGNCADPVGDPATVGCLGPTAVLLALDVAPGAVELPEGGSGFADAVRIQSITDDRAAYDVLSVLTTIAVPVDSDIVIPRFGGEIGSEVEFDLGASRRGSCRLTGDFPL